MNPSDANIEGDPHLRAVAEAQLVNPAKADTPERSINELLQDLRVHQVELEMQNEALRQTQIALENSRDRFVNLFEFAPVGYLTLTPDGLIAEINLTGARLLGRERKRLLNRRFSSLVIAEDQERWIRHFMTVKTYSQQGSVELALKRDDGTVFFAHLDCVCTEAENSPGSGAPDPVPEQRAVFTPGDWVRIALTDISERKQAEEALFDSHETLCSILATTKDGYWHVDFEGHLIDVNSVYCQQSGYLRRELVGMRISDLEAPESAAEIAKHIRQIIKAGSGQFESTQCRKDGSIWYAEVSVSYRDIAGGEFFVFLRDISERKQAEEALREQEAFFHLIAENIGDFIAVLDLEGRRLYNSPSYLQFFDASTDLRGTDSFAEIHPDDRERVKQVFRETVQTGIGRRLEYRFLLPDGRIYEMESRGSVIRDSKGRVERVVVVSHDVTARKQTEKALQESESFKNSILNSVASEIAVIDHQGIIRAVNERWRLFSLENGLVPGQPVAHTDVGSNYLAVCEAGSNSSAPEALEARCGIQAVLDGRLPSFSLEYPCHSAHKQRWFTMIVMPLGQDIKHGVVITHTDITAIKQAERYEQFRSHILELLAGGESLPGILDALVRGVEQLQPAMLCSILLLDSEGRHLGKGVAPSLPDFYNAALEGIEIGPGVGSCGTAAFTGERVIVEDIATHPYWAPYKALAASAGLGACWSQPFRASSGQLLGTFAIYHHEAHAPAESDIAIIEQSARLASIAIERNLAAEKLRDSEAHYRRLTEEVSDVLWKLDSDYCFAYISPADERLRGYKAEELIGHHVSEILTDEGIAAVAEMVRQREEDEQRGVLTGTSTMELQQRCKDGRLIWTEVLSTPLRDAHGTISGYHGISRNISERKLIEEQVRQLAYFDTLTELPNRRLLSDRLSQSMAASARNACYGAVMFLDLDNFKPLNDVYGHAVGDLLLIEVASRLKSCVREIDTVARFGGDEFVVMINELDTDIGESIFQAEIIAEKIRSTLSAPYLLIIKCAGGGETVVEHHCTASIGVVLFIDHEVSQEDILRRADATMYLAKAAGRNSIRFYAD